MKRKKVRKLKSIKLKSCLGNYNFKNFINIQNF